MIRKIYWTVKLATALFALAWVANAAAPGSVASVAGNAFHWASTEYQGFTNVDGQPSPTAVPVAPPPPAPLKLVLSAPPTFGAAPVATAISASIGGWSSAQCSTMEADMANDEQLDANTASQDASSNPSLSAYYATASGHWATVLQDIKSGPCADTPQALSGTQCSDPESWFKTAIVTHQADEAKNPQNKTWDDEWTQIYQTANSLWASAGC